MTAMPKFEEPRRSGKRRAYEEDVINDRLVEEYDASSVRHARQDVRYQIKWVRQHLNRRISLPLSAWYLLDELISLSHDIDWQGGPITVWPSNDLMMTWLDVEERTLQVLLTRLRRANLICFIDSPTQQRWGRRDPATSRIQEAYGIDLRPLARRVPDLMALARSAQADRAETIRQRRAAKALAARIGEYIHTGRTSDAANDNWDAFEAQLRKAAEQLEPKRIPLDILKAVLEALRPLETAVKKAMVKLFRPTRPTDLKARRQGDQKESSAGESKDTHKTTTQNPSSNEEFVELSTESVGNSIDRSALLAADLNNTAGPSEKISAARHLLEHKITPALVVKACPRFTDVGDRDLGLNDWQWSDLVLLAKTNLHVMGVAPHAWQHLERVLGTPAASVAVAVVTEKFCRGASGSAPRVANPGGYLHWIAREAEVTGLLDLGGKIYALLPARQKERIK